ncbi:glycosyltransferase family 61 protein [Algoriphagus formosus]|uniref:glycosyltransferase family 61 protein n=1 Tax=Algoriphagus formosus TaxID=2007308 RepID=UPI000C2862B0|nr:glycosyltransferase family 61 protein [Algoriphagus formosus]
MELNPEEGLEEEIRVQRGLPSNVRKEDKPLFNEWLQSSFIIQPCWVLNDALILQDTVFSWKELKFFASHTHVNGLGVLPLGKRVLNCAFRKWRTIESGIWIKDEWSANYFHWMTDCLPRIWQGLEKGVTDQVILHEAYQKLPFVSQSLKLLGIKAIFYSSFENLKVKKLVLTSRTAVFPHFHPEYTLETRNRLSKISKAPYRKIYISRSLAPKRRVLNEKEVELCLNKKGFEIYHSEKLSVKKQIELMGETAIFISLHGAALTNMLFLPMGCKVVELRNHEDDQNQCYFNLANVLGHEYYYTLNEGTEKDTILANFKVDIEALEKLVNQLVQE